MKMKMIVIFLLIVVISQAKDNLIFSGGMGRAYIDGDENKFYEVRVSIKNQKVIAIMDYSKLLFPIYDISPGEINEKMTDREVDEISFMMGKCLPFGKYSSLNVSSGIGVIFVKKEFNNSYPLLPEQKSKDITFPIDVSINIGLLKNVGISTQIKKSFNDISQYFSYSFSLDLIF